MKKPTVSVVIVAYRDMEHVARCVETIGAHPDIEIVIVNNSHQNRGFGAGCNLGALWANGETLIFLNPDTEATADALFNLHAALRDEGIGIIGPALTNDRGVVVSSASEQPTRLNFWWVYSFLNTLFPWSSWSQQFWHGFAPPAERTTVGVVSGAAMAMRKKVFDEIGGFDEHFFLYWEEVDLARRCFMRGWDIVYEPAIVVKHVGGTSTPAHSERVMMWFRASRHYFMKKYFGWIYAAVVEGFLSASEHWQWVVGLVGLLALSWSHDVWVGTAAVTVMTMVYNEATFYTHHLNAALIGFLAGLLVFFTMGIAGYILLTGVVWAVIDLIPRLERWRKLWVMAVLVGIVCLV